MKNIALVAGGYTGESVISMKSAAMVEQNLDRDMYQVYQVLVMTDRWVYRTKEGEEYPIDKNDFSITVNGTKTKFDCAFIIIHGTPGEDGKLQGYFDMINVPYTTCDATTSAITMNKAYTKDIIAKVNGVSVARSLQLFKDRRSEVDEISSQLKLPLFIKPNSGGSSIGMSKVTQISDISDALDKAFTEDDQVLVEEFIQGREFTVGVVRLDGKIQVLPATEIISSKDFFDYEAKYTPGVSQEITPAELSAGEVEKVKKAVIAIYEILNCRGVVRIDFILQKETNNLYILEVNTVPGQSENSIIPQQVKAAGISMKEFYSKLVEEALK